jgi:hypothetical protein
VSTKSIQAKIGTATEVFTFSLGGVLIPMHALSSTPNYTLYGGEISTFGNQIAELQITALPTLSKPFNALRLDSIVFSDQAVPEPSTFGLFGIVALLLGWRLWKMREF